MLVRRPQSLAGYEWDRTQCQCNVTITEWRSFVGARAVVEACQQVGAFSMPPHPTFVCVFGPFWYTRIAVGVDRATGLCVDDPHRSLYCSLWLLQSSCRSLVLSEPPANSQNHASHCQVYPRTVRQALYFLKRCSHSSVEELPRRYSDTDC